MNNSQLINQTSGEVEYYTPPNIVEAAREVLGGFDLDPASSTNANKVIRARAYYTASYLDGMLTPWGAQAHPNTVWLNHPFGRAEDACPVGCQKKHAHHNFPYYGNKKWIQKLMDEYAAGRVKAAICITYACTSEKWFEPLLDYPQCFLHGRTNYYLPDGTIKKGVTKGSVLTLLARDKHDLLRFTALFSKMGTIKIKHS